MKNGRPQKTSRPRAVSNAAIEQALRESSGIYSAASQWIAQNIGVNYSRQAIAKRVQASPELQKVLEDTIEETIDVAESRLQELMQRDGRMPSYDDLSMEGPPHAPVFSYRVLEGERELGAGVGTSKQNAQQAAARYHSPVTRFVRDLQSRGSVAAVRDFVRRRAPSDAFASLEQAGHLELSPEATVIQARYGPLFTDEEINTCLTLLLEAGYF